jgi:hypothetical protein
VDAGKILTKESSTADVTVTFNPAEIFKLSDNNQTINLKLLARFSLLTPDGSVYSNVDLHSTFSPPRSGATGVLQYSIVPTEGTARVTEHETLYHNRGLAKIW